MYVRVGPQQWITGHRTATIVSETMNPAHARKHIRDTIEKHVYVDATDEPILDRRTGTLRDSGWLFDFRRALLRPSVLRAVSALFWDTFKDARPLQMCGLEVAAVPLVTALSLLQDSDRPAHAFFIRKSRKKDGLMRMIEGEPAAKDVPVVLVDDILNSGKSFIRQVEVLEELGYTVRAVWAILRFRDESFYDYFRKKSIAVHSVFTLDDFRDSLGVRILTPPDHTPPMMPFCVVWKFASEHPNYAYVVPKSDPVLDADKIYFGSDSGHFWALHQEDGATAWSYKVGFHARGKSIFSSPALTQSGLVIFGAYDGNVYALDTATGKKKWIFWEADYIGSSPAVAEDLGLVFVGLEFGLIKKHGGIAALDVRTGKKVWEYPMAAYTHSSPLYIPEKTQVVVGGNEGIVYLFDARSGTLIWTFATGEASDEELARGLSRFDIKESFAYDATRDLIVFGNHNAQLFALRRKDGSLAWRFDAAEFAYHSTPLIHDGAVYASSLDKRLYCVDLTTGEERWRWHAGARIFASPVLINDKVYIGANTGRLTELDPETGRETAFLTVSERITNKVAYNPKTKRYFLPTFANEVYCLERHDDDEQA